MKYHFVTMVMVWMLVSSSHAQTPLLDDIKYYSDIVLNAIEASHRTRANDSLLVRLSTYLDQPDMDVASLREAPWISTQIDTVAGWALITWQVAGADDNYHAEGFLRTADGVVTRLSDAWPQGGFDGVCTASSWYGARYYGIVPVDSTEVDTWILLGYKIVDKSKRQRIAEVLTIDANSLPRLGTPLFHDATTGQTVGRVIVSYSPQVSAQMRYDEALEAIIYDHVTTLPNGIMAGDGTFQGYRRDRPHWVYVDRFFHTTVDEAPSDREERPSRGRSSTRR